MSEKKSYNFKSAFDDRSLPVNDLSAERMAEIEKALMPELLSKLNRLREKKPSLFRTLLEK
ncbi:MAG: hypothetical protein ACKVOQ_22110 [Cyclobacteriaceae bacterium]